MIICRCNLRFICFSCLGCDEVKFDCTYIRSLWKCRKIIPGRFLCDPIFRHHFRTPFFIWSMCCSRQSLRLLSMLDARSDRSDRHFRKVRVSRRCVFELHCCLYNSKHIFIIDLQSSVYLKSILLYRLLLQNPLHGLCRTFQCKLSSRQIRK